MNAAIMQPAQRETMARKFVKARPRIVISSGSAVMVERDIEVLVRGRVSLEVGEPSDDAYIDLAEACLAEGMIGLDESEAFLAQLRRAT